MIIQNYVQGRGSPYAPSGSSHQREDFLACLAFFAHEARVPLQLIEEAVLAWKESSVATPSALNECKKILLQVEDIRRILHEVGDFSPGNVELRMKPIELGPVILDSVELVRPLFEAKSQNFLCVVDPMPIRIMGDSARLIQVFSNLLSNASKYSPSHSKIEITAHHVGDAALVFVRDEGIGLEAKDRDLIFDLSYHGARADHNGTKDGGLGLGLVSQLVKLHHGTLEAKSDGVACGSEFIVRLPIDQTHRA